MYFAEFDPDKQVIARLNPAYHPRLIPVWIRQLQEKKRLELPDNVAYIITRDGTKAFLGHARLYPNGKVKRYNPSNYEWCAIEALVNVRWVDSEPVFCAEGFYVGEEPVHGWELEKPEK
jgi:hypothetical protein